MVVDCGYVEATKLLTLKQYIHIYNEIIRQAASTVNVSDTGSSVETGFGDDTSPASGLDTSVLMMRLGQYDLFLLQVLFLDIGGLRVYKFCLTFS